MFLKLSNLLMRNTFLEVKIGQVFAILNVFIIDYYGNEHFH